MLHPAVGLPVEATDAVPSNPMSVELDIGASMLA
jgi:hypothetical protein